MMSQRNLGVWFAAAILVSSLACSNASAQFFFYSPRGPYLAAPLTPPMGFQYPVMSNYSYSNYVAPYPAYGILPPPFFSNYGYNTGAGSLDSNPLGMNRTSEDYGYGREYFDQAPRKRNTLYPAVPFEAGPKQKVQDPQADARRVRIEVKVPNADATVLIDGNATRQAGIDRVYLTPPLEEDRLYSFTLEIRWLDENGKEKTAKHTYENVFAGDTKKYPPTK